MIKTYYRSNGNAYTPVEGVTLTNEDFEKLGFNTDTLPFKRERASGDEEVFPNEYRDASGRYVGFIFQKPIWIVVKTKEDLIKALSISSIKVEDIK